MPRKYKLKNRYCRNTKLNEAEFETLVNAYIGGATARVVAEQLSRSERSIAPLLHRLRERFCEDEVLFGWMGAGNLPPADDPVWSAIHDCFYHCPSAVDDRSLTSPEFVSRWRGTDPSGDHKQRTLTLTPKKPASNCHTCPVRCEFDFDYNVRKLIAAQRMRFGGLPRDKFRGHYFEIMIQANTRFPNSKFPDEGRSVDAPRVLERLAQEPL